MINSDILVDNHNFPYHREAEEAEGEPRRLVCSQQDDEGGDEEQPSADAPDPGEKAGEVDPPFVGTAFFTNGGDNARDEDDGQNRRGGKDEISHDRDPFKVISPYKTQKEGETFQIFGRKRGNSQFLYKGRLQIWVYR